MSVGPASFIDAFEQRRVLVLGEAMLDAYLVGSSDRLCQEAPVPVVAIGERRYRPGGAGNAAANVVDLGARAELVSIVGDDPEGDRLRDRLQAAGIGTGGVVVAPERETLAKQRVLAGSQLVVRFDQGTTTSPPSRVEDALLEALERSWERCDAVLVSDYGYGALTARTLAELARLQASSPRLVVVDAKDLRRYAGLGVTAVKPNYAQALEFLEPGSSGKGRAEDALRAAERMLACTGAQIVAVTLDVDGSVVVERGRPPYRTFARPASATSSAGAGDTFVCAFTLALASGADTPSAAELASQAAARVVSKEGTATCSALELRESFTSSGKLLSGTRLVDRLEFLRRQGRRVVFTNGCFDILHRGHITYLNRAKELGDVLIVGVNTDAGVARLKGPSRPINALEDRVEVLSALSSVDHVVTFEEDTPERLIGIVQPDVFVKGGDYTLEMLPEAAVVQAHGGTVHLLPFVDDRSTSGIIERIRSLQATSSLGG